MSTFGQQLKVPNWSVFACMVAQQNLPAEEKDEKEQKVFDNVQDRLDMYWDRKVHDGFHISSRDVTRSEHNGTTGGHEITKKMLQSSMRGISDDEQSSSISRNGSTYQNIWIDNMASSASGKAVVETECECMADGDR